MEKYCRVGETIDDKIIRRMRFACRIPKSTDTYPDYVILSCFSNATLVTRTRPDVTLYPHFVCLVCFL